MSTEKKYKEIRQMTEDETVTFVYLFKATESQSEELFIDLASEPGGWVLKAIEKRFLAYKTKCDAKTMIMILSMGDGAVGKCVKYIDDIVERAKLKEIEYIDFESFSKKIYPMGIPVL